MIDHSCPIIVIDDEKQELWEIAHGLGLCGLPIVPHLIVNGRLERNIASPCEGIRILFTDLHVLGPVHSKPEQYVSALVNIIRQLISPSTYLIVFWSAFPEEAEMAWGLLVARLNTMGAEGLVPFNYCVLDKTEVKNISDEDEAISLKATENVRKSIRDIFDKFPQLRSFMQWESSMSRAASATSNELIGKLNDGGIEFTNCDAVRDTLKRMSQEALGFPHAYKTPTKGVFQALMPITQDWLNKESDKGVLDQFLGLTDSVKIALPKGAVGCPNLASLLNDFFIHSEQSDLKISERGAVIQLAEDFLERKDTGLVHEIGLATQDGDWREAMCMEFAIGFSNLDESKKEEAKSKLNPSEIFAVELSADCDYAQDKARSLRFLLAIFVPATNIRQFYSETKKSCAHDAIYMTPDITIGGTVGRLLISCRVFLTRPYQRTLEGSTVTRIRQEVLSEIAHRYVTHVRRPGKIAFYG